MVNWLQMRFDLPEEEAAPFSDRLTEAGAIAVTFLDAADAPIFEPPPGATPIWKRTVVVGLFTGETEPDRILSLLKADGNGDKLPAYQCDLLENRDWERGWIDHIKPMRFGDRLWICPSTHQPPEPDAVNLRLDPGLAFGTGTHETTALCLEWLDGADLEGKEIIDYGCGSGVLAIAALLLGANHAWAVDIDPMAVETARENAKQNGVVGRLDPVGCDGLPELKADLLLANILARPLIELAEPLADHLKPGGEILLTGLLHAQVQEVSDVYSRWFRLGGIVRKGEWSLLTAVRR